MKKILLSLLLVIPFSAVSAQDMSAERVKDMHSMYVGMGLIQEGFLLNCESCMQEGIAKVQSGLKTLTSVDAKVYLPKEQAYAYKFAQKTARKITLELEYLKLSLKKGDIQDAGEAYTNIGMQCLYCHKRIRDWKPKKFNK